MSKIKPLDGSGNADSSDQAFIEVLYRKYNSSLMRYLQRQRIEHQEAADIAQEAYCRIAKMQRAARIDYPQAFLFRTAANLLINNAKYWQHRHSDQTVSIDTVDIPDGAPSPHRFVQGRQELELVTTALQALSSKCRAAFVMHRFGGATYPQIADNLGISVSMVEKYISQALAHLKISLRQTQQDRESKAQDSGAGL